MKERVGSYPDVGDVVLGGNGIGSGGGSTSSSICNTWQLSGEEVRLVNGDCFAWPPTKPISKAHLLLLFIHLHACTHQNVLLIYIFIYTNSSFSITRFNPPFFFFYFQI